MFFYKRVIKSGDMFEVEYYSSIKERNKKNIGRQPNRNASKENQKIANKVRAEKHTQRLIACNFTSGDWWVRLSAPYGTFDSEESINKAFKNFCRRVSYACEKKGIVFKYIATIECGKSGKNWHIHIIVEDKIKKIIQKCWKYESGQNFTPLYQQGNYAQLAKYIRKDIAGTKRIKTSKNLIQPTEHVTTAKGDFKKLSKGEMITIPDGYYLDKDSMNDNTYNDVYGVKYYFCFMKMSKKQRR